MRLGMRVTDASADAWDPPSGNGHDSRFWIVFYAITHGNINGQTPNPATRGVAIFIEE